MRALRWLPLLLWICLQNGCKALDLEEALNGVDLHIHSTYSDGTVDPVQLVREAYETGLKIIAITDHDQLRYSVEAQEEAKSLGITLLQGVEISVEWHFSEANEQGMTETKAHLLGYFTRDSPKTQLYKLLNKLQYQRDHRNEIILNKLFKLYNIKVSIDEVRNAATIDGAVASSVGRPHIAKVLVAKGHASNIKDAFDQYLSDDKLQLENWSLDMVEAIKALDKHRAIAVLAHPATTHLTPEELDRELNYLLHTLHAPLKGLECYSSRHTLQQSADYQALAYKHGLIITGGSDYHGNNKVNAPLGEFGGGSEIWNLISDSAYQQLYTTYTTRKRVILGRIIHDLVKYLSTYGIIAIGISWLAYVSQVSQPNPIQTRLQRFIKHPYIHWLFATEPVPAEKKTDVELGPVHPSGTQNGTHMPSTSSKEKGLSALSTTKQAIICFVGLQTMYVSWGYFQERIMQHEYGSNGERFRHSEFLVFANRISALLIAAIMLHQGEPPKSKAPPYTYLMCSISNVMSSWFQYEALKYVSFPLQVLSKSSKIIASMGMGRLLYGKSYTWSQYGTASLITMGLTLYKLTEDGDDKQAADMGLESHVMLLIGCALLLGYIFCDSFTSQWQAGIFKRYSVNKYQMMLGVNTFSSALTLSSLFFTGFLWDSLLFMHRYPIFILHCALMSICSAVGQIFIFHTIAKFGAVAFAYAMTARQFLSIVVSIFAFGHAINVGGYLGLTFVFASLLIKLILGESAGG